MIISKMIGDKRRYRAYKARTKLLPAGYGTAIDGIARYLMVSGPGDADNLSTMLEDLADLFEQGAADGTPLSEVVGQDPVEFVEAFQRNYPHGQWINKERQRLNRAIKQAEAEEGSRVTTTRVAIGPAIRVQGLQKSYQE